MCNLLPVCIGVVYTGADSGTDVGLEEQHLDLTAKYRDSVYFKQLKISLDAIEEGAKIRQDDPHNSSNKEKSLNYASGFFFQVHILRILMCVCVCVCVCVCECVCNGHGWWDKGW